MVSQSTFGPLEKNEVVIPLDIDRLQSGGPHMHSRGGDDSAIVHDLDLIPLPAQLISDVHLEVENGVIFLEPHGHLLPIQRVDEDLGAGS